MASVSYLASPILLRKPSTPLAIAKPWNPALRLLSGRKPAVGVVRALSAVVETERRLYVGNIPRNVTNEELAETFGQYGSVEKAEVMYDKYSGRSRRFGFVTMTTVEDANAATEKLDGTEIGGRTIKVNVTEKPLEPIDLSLLQAEESNFVDSPHKVYVGNLVKTVTADMLKSLFSTKTNVLSVKISREPDTFKSRGFGFVSFSSEEEAEAAIEVFHNRTFEGRRIRVNKAFK